MKNFLVLSLLTLVACANTAGVSRVKVGQYRGRYVAVATGQKKDPTWKRAEDAATQQCRKLGYSGRYRVADSFYQYNMGVSEETHESVITGFDVAATALLFIGLTKDKPDLIGAGVLTHSKYAVGTAAYEMTMVFDCV